MSLGSPASTKIRSIFGTVATRQNLTPSPFQIFFHLLVLFPRDLPARVAHLQHLLGRTRTSRPAAARSPDGPEDQPNQSNRQCEDHQDDNELKRANALIFSFSKSRTAQSFACHSMAS